MATVRSGNQGVLVVVDVQVGAVDGTWEIEKVVANVALAVERARAAKVPVVWVQHNDEELVKGSPAWQWVAPLVPGPGEPVVHKNYNSGFEETDLETHLAALGTTHVVLAGAATNWCIRATAYGALDRGYDLTLVSDAHTTGDIDLGTETVPAANIVRDLNVTMQWVSYPGRVNGAAPAASVDFSRPGGAR